MEKNKNVYLSKFVFILLFIVSVSCARGNVEKNEEQQPHSYFTHQTLVYPQIFGRQKREIPGINHENISDLDAPLTISVVIDNQEFVVDLKLNKKLVSKNFFRKTQENGKYETTTPSAQETKLCHYQGHVRNISESWAAISTCGGISGVIFDGKDLHYIENDQGTRHLWLKHSDLKENNWSCGYRDQHTVQIHQNNLNRLRRGALFDSLKDPRYVELLLVIDHSKYKELNQSITDTQNYALSVANIVNQLYAPLNIFIALAGVVIWTERDEIDLEVNGDRTLSNFLRYRRNITVEHPNDNAHLITKTYFEGGVTVTALKGPICTYEYSGGITSDLSGVVGLTANTIAHGLGHNFGMEHDSSDCSCVDDRCMMASSFTDKRPPVHWSSCSKDKLEFAFNHGMDYCLRNKPGVLFGGPVCGNSFVEEGEECDCGSVDHCNNTCCDAATCKRHNNASCATGDCCDLLTCRIKPSGVLCRESASECDRAEYCTGDNTECPEDIYKSDGLECGGENQSFCHQGVCPSRSQRCKLLWGPSAESAPDGCYNNNPKGNRFGNCGYDLVNHTYIKCIEEDKLCGRLHCTIRNPSLQFGLEYVSIISQHYTHKHGGNVEYCVSAVVDLGLQQVDPGLVPDGAKCGDNKMCLKQQCVNVHRCPNDCHGNGSCYLGSCTCKPGYVGRFCQDLYSEDSALNSTVII